MKLLYLSCHSILEYDELRLFEALGVDYFSLGSYIRPTEPVDPIRPALTHTVDPDLLAVAPPRDNIPKEFFDQFDTIMIMHVPEWVEIHWEKMKHKRVIWRSIGQSTQAIERRLWPYRKEGLEIVRYSPMEANIAETAGCNKIIRFYKDPDEFGPWMGAGNEVITFAQDMEHRGQFCNAEAFKKIVEPFTAHVYGPKNELSGALNGGFLSYDMMKQKMRDARAYVYTGTQPASYTLGFIEALMTGIPMVALGPILGNSMNISGDVYEVPKILNPGVNGYYSDNIEELQKTIRLFLDNYEAAKRIGEMGRKTAIELFGMTNIKTLWKEYLHV